MSMSMSMSWAFNDVGMWDWADCLSNLAPLAQAVSCSKSALAALRTGVSSPSVNQW
jgi:hypothetical protein